MPRVRNLPMRWLGFLGAVCLALGPPLHVAAMAMGSGVISVEPASQSAADAEPLEMTIEVSTKGLNAQKGLVIDASQGQELRLTFVWADKTVPDNSHRILVKGYNLRTPLLTPEKPQATLTFTADQAGDFEIACDWRCQGHENLQAVLRVRGSTGASAEQASVATNVSLVTEPQDESAWRFVATLTDASGAPLSNAPLHFYLEKSFAGVSGRAEIGDVTTNQDGKANLTYQPARPGSDKGVVEFAGVGRYAPSASEFEISAPKATAYVPAPKGLTSIRNVAPLVVAMVISLVWLTIGYVVLNIVGIYQVRPSRSRGQGQKGTSA